MTEPQEKTPPDIVMAGRCPACASWEPCEHDVPCGIGGCTLPAGHVPAREHDAEALS